MVHKRYIKRDGKIYGPYFYKSIRTEDGKVRNVYLGMDYVQEKKRMAVSVGKEKREGKGKENSEKKTPPVKEKKIEIQWEKAGRKEEENRGDGWGEWRRQTDGQNVVQKIPFDSRGIAFAVMVAFVILTFIGILMFPGVLVSSITGRSVYEPITGVLVLGEVQEQVVHVGQEYDVIVMMGDVEFERSSGGAGVFFRDDSELFDIERDGRIKFVAGEEDIGMHSVGIVTRKAGSSGSGSSGDDGSGGKGSDDGRLDVVRFVVME
jgi:hypothetical protein